MIARFLLVAFLFVPVTCVVADDAPPTKPLSAEAARLLVSRKDHVRFMGSEISEEAAVVLAEHEGDLTLVLEQLSMSVAERLAKHEGRLSVDATRRLSEDVIEALQQHHGDLAITTPFQEMFKGDLNESVGRATASTAKPLPPSPPVATQADVVAKLKRFEAECDQICTEMLAAYRAVSDSPLEIVTSAGDKLGEMGRNPEKRMNGKGISAGCARATMTYLGMCSFLSLEAAASIAGQQLPDGGMVGMVNSMLTETDERLRRSGNAEEYWTHMALVRASLKHYADTNTFNGDFERQLIEGGAQPVVIREMQRLRRDIGELLMARYATGIKYAIGTYGPPPFSER